MRKRKGKEGLAMICHRLETCGYFQKYKDVIGDQRYDLMVRSYCKGPLQPLCKRLKYLTEKGEDPPVDLRPDGYESGTNNKMYW
jgi:hypothetical protein